MRLPGRGPAVRAAILLALGMLVILVGQIGRDLLPPDDLREAEVAREMMVSGDFVIPHLAGIPFLEKPPGFPALLAEAFRLVGRPSVPVSHLVSAGFALASLIVIFLTGRRIGGVEAGGLAALLEAASVRFVKASHEVHLDLALNAACALALLFAWRALESEDLKEKEQFYAGAGFALGLAFLVKGFVGPVLFGVGFLGYLAASGRKGELREALRPLPIACFIAPTLVWIAPFLRDATPHHLRDFFLRNQAGRLLWGYGTHAHPIYYHLAGVFWDFAPGSVLLPFAAIDAWRKRRDPASQGGIFFLSMAAGVVLLLTISRSKGPLYLLPAFPALALLAGCWCAGALAGARRFVETGCRIAAGAAWIFAASAIGAMLLEGSRRIPLLMAVTALVGLGLAALRSLRHRDLRNAAVGTAALLTLGWIPIFSGPLAAREIAEKTLRPSVEQVYRIAGDRDLLLYCSSDPIRGAAGFYRNRTAVEARSVRDLLSRLLDTPSPVLLLHLRRGESPPPEISEEAIRRGARVRQEASIPGPDSSVLVMLSVVPRGRQSSSPPK